VLDKSRSEQSGNKARDGVCREYSIIGRKLIRRQKQNRLEKMSFVISGPQERGSM